MMFDGYNQGYTKALLDVRDFFEYHSDALKYERCYNSKMIPIVLNGLIDARHEMIKVGGAHLSMKLSKDRKRCFHED